MLTAGCDNTHPFAPILHDIRKLIREIPYVKRAHSYREANKCADSLADNGHSLDLGVHYFTKSVIFPLSCNFFNIFGTLFDMVV